MNETSFSFADPAKVKAYVEQGPPAFAPGHSGMLQMIGVLLAECVPSDGEVLVIGAGGGLEVRHLAGVSPNWRFVGVDPARSMLDLARAIAGATAGDRLTLIEGTAEDAPPGPYDAATCILVLGLIPDGGAKLATLQAIHRRLRPGNPFILVDQCIDRTAADVERRLDRYAGYARRSGVDAATVADARKAVAGLTSMAPAWRNEELLREAGFRGAEIFYVAMAWRGWIAYA